jgi:uncharacterized protein (DUF488 family)
MVAAGDIHTVGHSTHELDRFIALLRGAGIEEVADVRRYPGSRRNPQFNAGTLAAALRRYGIALKQFGETLGGRRRARPDSPNGGWRVEAFRGYADHMESDEFAGGLQELERLALSVPTALMCAEADWRRCHRRLIADALTVRGWRVHHLLADGRPQEHELPAFAVAENRKLSYPPGQTSLQ